MASTQNTTTHSASRRDFLGKAALAGVASALTTATTLPALASPNPDAELIAAWTGFVKANRDFEHACEVLFQDGGTDEDHDPYYKTIEFYGDQIERHQASTVEGLSIQLRYLFAKKMESMDAFRAAIYGEPVTDRLAREIDENFRDKLLWNMVQSATRTGGVA